MTALRLAAEDGVLCPGERVKRHGAEALADHEAVAMVTGAEFGATKKALARLGGLGGAYRASFDLLATELGEDAAARLDAARSLAGRFARRGLEERELLDQPALVADFVSLRFYDRHQERLGALLLDCHSRLLDVADVFVGTADRTAVMPQPILREAILAGAASFIIFHTHPSGSPSPSIEDLAFAKRMTRAGEEVGVRMVDMVIVGGGGQWISLRRRGVMS